MSHQGGQQAGHQSATPNFTNMSNTGSYTTPDKINAPTFTNPPFKGLGGTTAPVPSDGLIQRGYMRLLTEVFEYGTNGTPIGDVGGALSHDLGTKLDFQFNPSELTRSVAARTDTQLWINQSPSQLLQPGIGDMSFSWQMLFNRETEVQKGDVAGRLKKDWEFETVGSRLDAFSKENAASADEAAEELGVLADIAILDRITGQSISAEAIQYAQDRYNRLVASGAITEEDKVDIDTDSIVAMAESKGVSLKEANVQNSAFLVPNPIRVVFSENFMVDGYVNSVTVSFKKFSTQMVPTVALVDVSMHAIYQGFSRYTSTFTTILELSKFEDNPDTVLVDPDLNSELGVMQEKGKVVSVLGAIDHSPIKDHPLVGWAWPGIRVPGDPETKLENHKNASSEEGGYNCDLQSAQPFKIHNGISFGVASRLSGYGAGAGLGGDLLDRYQNGNLVVSQLSAEVSLGLRVHARLRPIQQVGGITPKAMLDALIAEGDTPEDGFKDHEDSAVFFGKWSAAQRKALLAVGDGMDGARLPSYYTPESHSATRGRRDFDEFDGQTVSTRSFPITCTPNGFIPPHTYGDLLGMHTVDYPKGEVFIEGTGKRADDVWIWLNWRTAYDDDVKWSEDKTLYYIGKGFYDGTDDDSAFPNTLTIPHDTTTANDLVFEVDYQMNLLFRTKLKYDDGTGSKTISDTGWLRNHPRTINTALLGSGGVETNSMRLLGSMVGNKAVGLGLDSKFPWQYDQRGANLHLDGHIGDSNGCIPWSHQETNEMVLDEEYETKDISVYISSRPDGINNTRGYI